MAKFENAFLKTLTFEGVDFDSPHDPGGRTRYGITQAVAKRHGLDVRTITKDDAKKIYKKDYWTPLNLDGIAQEIADTVYDMGVNAGVTVGAVCFQRALNSLRQKLATEEKIVDLFSEIKVDGQIGPETLEAYKKIAKKDFSILKTAINGFRFEYYRKIKKPFFNRSWFRRLI